MLRDQLKAFAQLFLHQFVAFLQRLAVFPEDGFTVRVTGDDFTPVGLQIVGQRIVHREALFRQLNRRADHLVQRHGAVFFQR